MSAARPPPNLSPVTTASPSAPPDPTRVVLVRHGESIVTTRRVVGGPRTCTGLSELGRRQVDALADRLRRTGELRVDALYSSAYPRAIETAEALRAALGLPVRIEPGFGEHDPGPECDGLTFDGFVERFGVPDWEGDPHAVTFPGGGETLAEFHHRVGTTLHRVLAEHSGATVLVACHGGVIDAILRTALHAPPTGAFELLTGNASLTELVRVRPGRWRLVRYNDLAHLADLADLGTAGSVASVADVEPAEDPELAEDRGQ